MTVRRLQYFVTVADELSFTAAARVLHMAQPPLSTQIRELEHELGVELFRRGPRGIALTAAGQALLPEARQLLERYELLPLVARRAGAGEVGRLAVGLVPSAANGRLPQVLRRFGEKLPDVQVSLVEDRPAELLRQLDAGQLDVVLQYSPPVRPVHVGRVLAEEALVVALPPGHRLASRRSVPLKALADEPFILPMRHGGEGLYERISKLLADHQVVPDVVQSDIWLLQTIVGLVAAGVGLSIVPESASVIRGGEVVYRPIAGRVDPVPLVALWRLADESPTVRRFVAEWA